MFKEYKIIRFLFKIVSFKVEESQIYEDLTHPSICHSPEHVKERVRIFKDAYSASEGCHALVICTEWDEFVVSKILTIMIGLYLLMT